MSSFADIEPEPATLAAARRGDARATAEICRSFQRPVFTLACRLVGRRAVAEELAQDVFVELLTHLDQYQGRGAFAGWVRTITVRRCLMHLRSPWHRGVRWLETPGGDEPGDGARGAAADEHSVDLERALARLGPVTRCVVWLHDVEGYNHAEIGRLLGGTASLSKSQLARGHARLRALLERPGDETPCMQASTSC